ncbi:MAG: acylglycerol kinase family protein, partial [Peptoniphilaceae bacterium]|nr:acylglycerol kinase family protein [Peptoniphilaceae bacterium]MDY3075246.1 acylglycerol kinase family protein [Peptoniphilaceae bacterium]
ALVFATRKEGDAKTIVRAYGEEVEDIVTMGGDGTLSEVTSALMTLQHRPPVGYIPAGTTNDFASGVGLSELSPERAVAIATTGEGQALDMGRINGTPFLYVAAFEILRFPPQSL